MVTVLLLTVGCEKDEMPDLTVTFDSRGGTAVASQTVTCGKRAEEPKKPTKKGYTFEGWYPDNKLIQKFDFNTFILNNTTLYAKWILLADPDSIYIVKFQTNGGSPISDKRVPARQTVERPSQPTKDGYSFENWYGDKDFIQVFSFDGEITQDTTLYAKWISNDSIEYTVTFQTNGGSPPIPDRKVKAQQKITPPNTPTKAGYHFENWYGDKDFIQVFSFGGEITQDTTLYANWVIMYTVKFDTDGGTPIPDEKKVPAGRKVERPTQSPTKPNTTFIGWYADKESNLRFDFDGLITRDTTLYAKWGNKVVAGVSLRPPILYLTVGETGTLTATITPADAANQAVRWKSDGPDIATVDNGTVTAVAPGTTTIIVTSVGDPTKTATAQVIVRAATGPKVTLVVEGSSYPGTLNTDGTVKRPTALEDSLDVVKWFVHNNFSCTDENIFDFDSVITQNITLYGFRYTETPANKDALQDLVDAAISSNPTVNLNHINTAKVTSMSELFRYKATFNGDISCWNVENVTNMHGMFANTEAFNQPLNNWNVENVRSMYGTFAWAEAFNQPLNKWNVANVTTMFAMFHEAYQFNQPLNNWNVGNVTDMGWMFQLAKAFNQPLNKWNVKNVTRMRGTFSGAEAFNQNINNWKVNSAVSMHRMFWGAKAFNQPLNKWKVNNVTTMREMFAWAKDFNQPLDNWKVNNVKNMYGMFHEAKAFGHRLQDWGERLRNDVNTTSMFTGTKTAKDNNLPSWYDP